MLLQRLKEYADERLSLPPPLYDESPVRYIIELDGSGRLLSREPIDTADPSSPATKRGQRRYMPQVQRTSGVKPLLLVGNAEYTLGLARPKSKPERVAACHRAYLDLIGRCANGTREPAVCAVLLFLQDDPASNISLPDDFARDAAITFRVDGAFPVDLPSVQAFWVRVNDPSVDPDRPAPSMQCLICGKERPVLERLQGKIKGVPGGQTAGTAIVSANAEAFESYGLPASLVAPTCTDCGERFTKAANALISERASHIRLGGAVFIFWTREPVAFSLASYLDDPKPEDVKSLLESVRSGRRATDVDNTKFYATALSGSGGRAVVRDWIDSTVGDVKRSLISWFEGQRIVGLNGEGRGPLGLYALARATVRDVQKELAPPTPRAMLRAAVTGTPLPVGLLYQAVRRNRAEQGVTYQRVALIKLVLCRSNVRKGEEDRMVQLDSDNISPAYRCGRLLAVLEEVQRLAVPGAKATIVDRFFGTASSAPASVFGRLLRGAQPHLSKLQRDRPGAYVALQRRLEEIQAGLTGFPRILTLEDQGIFALGYYHQRAYDRAEAIAASQRRRDGQGSRSSEESLIQAILPQIEEEE
ncbi:MAG: type I-C CRISPR-associated protein Cas8c/Csd1 [Chloroflexi bacterium]|nr:type I-C CRISPR-associated protein Cas8c/Csd1 [Chloroflexota bacterium]